MTLGGQPDPLSGARLGPSQRWQSGCYVVLRTAWWSWASHVSSQRRNQSSTAGSSDGVSHQRKRKVEHLICVGKGTNPWMPSFGSFLCTLPKPGNDSSKSAGTWWVPDWAVPPDRWIEDGTQWTQNSGDGSICWSEGETDVWFLIINISA